MTTVVEAYPRAQHPPRTRWHKQTSLGRVEAALDTLRVEGVTEFTSQDVVNHIPEELRLRPSRDEVMRNMRGHQVELGIVGTDRENREGLRIWTWRGM